MGRKFLPDSRSIVTTPPPWGLVFLPVLRVLPILAFLCSRPASRPLSHQKSPLAGCWLFVEEKIILFCNFFLKKLFIAREVGFLKDKLRFALSSLLFLSNYTLNFDSYIHVLPNFVVREKKKFIDWPISIL